MEEQVNTLKTVNNESFIEKSIVEDVRNKSEEITIPEKQENDVAKVVSPSVLVTDENDVNKLENGLEKEADGNIDEDELLKDTETDTILKNDSVCCAEEEDAILEPNSDNSNALQSLNKETAIVDKEVSSNLENVETKQSGEKNEATKKCSSDISGRKLEEHAETNQSNESPFNIAESKDDKVSKDVSDVGSSDKKFTETNKVSIVESDFHIVESSNSSLKTGFDTDKLSVKHNAENLNDSFIKNVSDRGIENITINKDSKINVSVDNERDSSNDMTENENVTTFLHVDQDDARPDDSTEVMEFSGEDPFAVTAEDSINNIGNHQIDPANNDKSMDIDHVSIDSNKVVEENNSSNSNENISESNTEVDCTVNNILSSRPITPEVMEVESIENNNSSTSFSQVNSLPDNENNSNEENCNDECPKAMDTDSVTDINSACASQSKSVDINTNQNNADSNEQKSEESVTNKKKDQSLSLENSQNNHLSIVPDKDLQPMQEPNIAKLSAGTSPNSCRSKSSKTLSKVSKSKSKKYVSDESSDDSDFEVSKKSTSRPKRDAAKKAETQIKQVLSVAEHEQEVESVHFNSNYADNSDFEEAPAQESNAEDIQTCCVCKKVGSCKVNVLSFGKIKHFCNNDCFEKLKDVPEINAVESSEIIPLSGIFSDVQSADIQPIDRSDFVRKCSQCTAVVENDDEKTLSWETMDFCSEECLGKYQQELGSYCANCKGNVQPASLGKYCVRFGYEVKQFCCSSCLEEFKKGLKVCSFCQKDISSGAEGFLAPVGDKGTFKDFCTQACMEKYEQMSSNQPPPQQVLPCDVCANNKPVGVEVFYDSKVNKLCSDICFSAYKFANKLSVDRCDMCKKYFDKDAEGDKYNIFYDNVPHNFCCKTCMNVYILAKRKIVPCNWCKVKKYNFDMIKRVQSSGQVLMMCSLNCLTLYHVSVNAVSSRRTKCDMCMSVALAQYHLTMSDATIRNFCTYPCVMNFQQQYSKVPITLPVGEGPPIPTGAPKRVIHKADVPGGPVPIISSVTSLVNGQPVVSSTSPLAAKSGKPNLVTRLLEPPMCRNKNTQTRPLMNSKSVSCRPHTNSAHSQTEDDGGNKILIPIPVPIYVPCPMPMYSFPFPVPVPFAVPVPVPIFLPTTRNSIKGIVKEIKRIQEKVPSDPYEAELLMMAEMVAGDKKEEASSSDSEIDNEPAPATNDGDGEGEISPHNTETNNTFGEDIMQMALKMATELDTPSDDLETQLTPATISNQIENVKGNSTNEDNTKGNGADETRGRKRLLAKSLTKKVVGSNKKRKTNHNSDVQTSELSQTEPVLDDPAPDINMKLKYTFGVNAWKSWVTQKNAEIEEINSTNKKIKPMKTDILQLTTDELNFSLCMFVKEVKKPNGTQYAPDTIYYLCLGIQQYLFENGRIDNIFTDPYFEQFTDCLDEVARKFTELFNDHHYIVTRVEEEHLWESMQLGAHSPHVLLTSLLFFNTKYFNLTNSEEHMMLSFSHIMKHWKRNSSQAGSTAGGKAPGSRNVLLRFYPPQAVLDDPNLKKKKVYEQQEDEENPLRCPVKLYEFYLSKCPESVKTRTDVFYLQPERSCVPDSPVWYSTMALSKEPLEKMLNRVKMVKEINIALLMT